MAEVESLERLEGKYLREVMKASRRHPNLALAYDLQVKPLTIKKNVQILKVWDRMQQYPPESRMHDWIRMDSALPIRSRWQSNLPQIPPDVREGKHYDQYFEMEHEERTQKLMVQHRDQIVDGKSTACVFLKDFAIRDEYHFYLQQDLTAVQREILFAFRGSALGLAHNHAWAYGNVQSCPLCAYEIHTESHFLLDCPALRVDRAVLQANFTWYIRKIGEDNGSWMARIIATADLGELAKVLLNLKKQRMKKLAAMGIDIRPIM
jgi:hypothetical protein